MLPDDCLALILSRRFMDDFYSRFDALTATFADTELASFRGRRGGTRTLLLTESMTGTTSCPFRLFWMKKDLLCLVHTEPGDTGCFLDTAWYEAAVCGRMECLATQAILSWGRVAMRTYTYAISRNLTFSICVAVAFIPNVWRPFYSSEMFVWVTESGKKKHSYEASVAEEGFAVGWMTPLPGCF